MSSLTTTTINTANGTTDLTVRTGNTNGPSVIISAGTNLVLKANSTVNSITINTTSASIDPPTTFINSTTFSGPQTFSGVSTFNANATFNANLTLNGSQSFVGAATFSANTTFSANIAVTGRITATTNVSTNTVTANTISVVNGAVSSNTLTLGTSSITATLYANGYSRLPNGLLLQWGSVSANSTAGSVTFPAAFGPVFSMQTTTATVGTTYVSAITALSNTAASVRTSNATSATVYWQAIGL